MAGGSAPRFAPSDPSLPPPWKALVDGNTGYIYYWNTETNVTQYEKPSTPSGDPPLPPGQPPAPSLGSKQAALPVVASPDSHGGKHLDKRSSANTGMVPNNPNRVEGMHPMVSPQHMSGPESRFSSSGGHIPGGPHGDFSYGSNAPGHHQRPQVSDHHGRHMPDHHGRYISDHHSRSIPDHHGGHASDQHTRSAPDHHGGHITDHHSRSMPDHHGGHMSDHHSRPMSEHQGGHINLHGGHASAGRSGHSMSGNASRSSGHGMPGGGMHMNSSDNSWGGGSGRHAHVSPVGLKGASSARSSQDGGGAWSVTKLALPIPQRQQVEYAVGKAKERIAQLGLKCPSKKHHGKGCIANITRQIQTIKDNPFWGLWGEQLKEIEGSFGSAVMITFAFLRWVFLLNVCLSVLWIGAIVIPFFLHPPSSYHWRGIKQYFQVNGLEKTWILLGGYFYKLEQIGWYRTDYMYPCTIAAMLLISLVTILSTIARRITGSGDAALVYTSDTFPYATVVFTAWDFRITSLEAATKLRKGIRMQLREMLADSILMDQKLDEESNLKYYKRRDMPKQH